MGIREVMSYIYHLVTIMLLCVVSMIAFSLIHRQEAHSQSEVSSDKKMTQSKKLDRQVHRASLKLIQSLSEEMKTEEFALTTLAVLPIKTLDDGAKRLEISSALTELFSTQLTSNAQVLTVERSRINSVIREINRQKEGEISLKGAAQAGKLLGAKYVLIGSITTIGAELQVTIRLVTSETGVIVAGEMIRAPRNEFVSFHRDVVVTKSKIGAAIRSAIIPGWGQVYNGQKIEGYTSLMLSLATLGTAGTYTFLGSIAEAKYHENKASTVPERKIANKHYNVAKMALLSYGAVWVYSIFDSYISGQSDPMIDLKGWADLNQAGVSLSGTF